GDPGMYANRLLLEIENVGDTAWRSLPPSPRGTAMVGGRLPEGDRFIGETLRALIPRDVYPGDRVRVEYRFRVPKPGRYRLDLDLVDEAVCWFVEHGSEVLSLEVSV